MKDQDKVRRIVPILHWQNVNVHFLSRLVDQDCNDEGPGASRLITAPKYVILRKSWRKKPSSFKLFGFLIFYRQDAY